MATMIVERRSSIDRRGEKQSVTVGFPGWRALEHAQTLAAALALIAVVVVVALAVGFYLLVRSL